MYSLYYRYKVTFYTGEMEMSEIKNVFSSITYYKKYNIILFIFFSMALLCLTCLVILDATREIKVNEISARWDIIYKFLPGMKANGFETFSAASQALKSRYHLFAKLVVAGISLLLMLLTGTLLIKRRRDINSLLNLGIKKWRVIFQLVVEALFPIIFSFFAILALLLIFQSSFKTATVSINDRLFNAELPYDLTFNTQHTTAIEPSEDKENVLLPFNEQSFYFVEASGKTFSYHNVFSVVSLSFIFLLMLSFLAVTLTTAFLVNFLAQRMYY